MSKTTNDLFILYILDGSGSMSDVQDDVVSGLNGYFEKQKSEKGKTRISLTVFDTELYPVFTSAKLKDITELTVKDTLKGGFTALLDAVGDTLTKTKDDPKYKDWKKLVVIHTDGKENQSKKFTSQKVNALVTELQDEGSWTFLFIGADIDAWSQAKDLGFLKTNTVSTGKFNTPAFYGSLTMASADLRGGVAMASASLGDTQLADVDEDKLKKSYKVLHEPVKAGLTPKS